MAHLFDTWAWVEYFRGTKRGERLGNLIGSGDHATSIMTLAELSDLYHRAGELGSEVQIAFIRHTTTILDLTPAIAFSAGRTKWEQRAAGRDLGLLDALIYETARLHNLTLLTGDPGFRGLPAVELLN